MNILLLDDELPNNYSGKYLRIVNILKRISKKHRVYFIYIGNKNIESNHLDILGKFCISIDRIMRNNNQWVGGRILNILQLKPGFYAKYKFKEDFVYIREVLAKFINENKINVMHIFSYSAAQYVIDFNNIIRIWDIGDSYSLNIKRSIKNGSFFSKINSFIYKQRLLKYEKIIINKFSLTIFVSWLDANVYSKLKLKNKICVIPNGVDLEYFNLPNNLAEEPMSLIFTGHMSFAPNIDAVKYFIKKIYPLVKKKNPQIKFYIVGADVNETIRSFNNKDDIIVTGQVDDIRPFLSKATVFVNPMISGSGIKNKILQAMAMKKAIVSTSLGVESICVTDNKDVLIADEPYEFADKIVCLIKDINLRLDLGKNARKTIEEQYNWEKVYLAYERLYNSFEDFDSSFCKLLIDPFVGDR